MLKEQSESFIFIIVLLFCLYIRIVILIAFLKKNYILSEYPYTVLFL